MTFETPGQIPIKFESPFDPAKIDERYAYAVRARITSADGRVMFATDTAYPVLTRGAGGSLNFIDLSSHREVLTSYLVSTFRRNWKRGMKGL